MISVKVLFRWVYILNWYIYWVRFLCRIEIIRGMVSMGVPATVKRWRERVVVRETPEMSCLADPFIAQEISRKQWIYYVIDGTKESDKVFFECDDFMILPDADAPNTNRVLNWLVIFKDLKLRRLRDLRGKHVSLLRCVRSKLVELFPLSETMLYFHNPPSVWQLHLHVASPCDVLRTTNDMQKVHFLDDVISNLCIDPDYYKKATMTFLLPMGHDLIQLLSSGGGGLTYG